MSIDAVRRDYAGEPLDRRAVGDDPIAFFRTWHAQAQDRDEHMATAIVLATVDGRGDPDVRVVLLRGIDSDGACAFYSSRASAKGRQLAAHPRAALLCHWHLLDRQVRIRGEVVELPRERIAAYFASRPRLSQIAAACAVQGTALEDRAELQDRFASLQAELGDAPVPLPEHWTGWRLVPDEFEFWQGQPGRLHDRLHCVRSGDSWRLTRLAP